MATPEKVTAGTSRSGRVIKKSAKVIEMEETEKSSSVPNVDKSNHHHHRTSLSDSLIATNGMKMTPEVDSNSSVRKRIKMKIPPPDKDFNSAIMMEGDDDGSSKDFEESIQSNSTSLLSASGG